MLAKNSPEASVLENRASVDVYRKLPGKYEQAETKVEACIVEFVDVCKSYQTGSIRFEALKNISCRIPRGETSYIFGPSGSGKTTFLNALSAFIPEGERIITIEDPLEIKLQQRVFFII